MCLDRAPFSGAAQRKCGGAGQGDQEIEILGGVRGGVCFRAQDGQADDVAIQFQSDAHFRPQVAKLKLPGAG